MDQEVSALATLVQAHQPCVVLTGAGISTESGIPDFRSPTGIWTEYDPMQYATIEAFRRDPVKVWEFYALRFELVTRAQPNAGHVALAELERRGFVEAVVTQNVDGLHGRAGSREVIEVHGSIRTARCLDCGEKVPLAEIVAARREAPAPGCPRCGSILKPDVVMFGELLPAEAIDRAFELAQGGRAPARRRLLTRSPSSRRAPPRGRGRGRPRGHREPRRDAGRSPRHAEDRRGRRRNPRRALASAPLAREARG